jgi:glycerophosphoryl diester phosphodiesterase
VHLSADGEMVLMHDETVERTTDLTGAIASMTLEQLGTADAGFRFEAPDGSFPFRGKGLTVPTLGEVLEWLPDGTGLVVEVKARAATAPAIEALRGSRVRAAAALSLVSFEESIIDEARGLDPEIPTGYLLVPSQPIEAALIYAVEHGHAAVHPYEGDLGLDPGPILAQAGAYGRLIGCYVVNDPLRMQQLAAYGLWAFVTDMPDVGRQALGPRAGS